MTEPMKGREDHGGSRGYNFLLIFFVALGSFTYGFNASIMGTVFGLSSFYSYFDLSLTGPGSTYANQIIGGKSCIGDVPKSSD
jgi:hypothetical protein